VTTLWLQTGNFACPEHACTMPRECTLRNNYYNAVDRDCAEEPASGNCTCFNGAVHRVPCFAIGACDTPATRSVKSFSHIDTAVPQSATRTREITRATRQSFAVFPCECKHKLGSCSSVSNANAMSKINIVLGSCNESLDSKFIIVCAILIFDNRNSNFVIDYSTRRQLEPIYLVFMHDRSNYRRNDFPLSADVARFNGFASDRTALEKKEESDCSSETCFIRAIVIQTWVSLRAYRGFASSKSYRCKRGQKQGIPQ